MRPNRDTIRGFVILSLVALFVAAYIMGQINLNASRRGAAQRAQDKNDITQIATAVNAYEAEYGRLPSTNRGNVGGELLAALMGRNSNLNPRGIVFLEVKPVTHQYHSGLTNGTFIDCWGGPYQIAFADGTNRYVTNAGPNHLTVPKRVAVWSDPNLAPDASSLSEAKKARRYVNSWE